MFIECVFQRFWVLNQNVHVKLNAVHFRLCIIAERLSARHPNSAARSRLAMFVCMYVCMYVSHASGIQL